MINLYISIYWYVSWYTYITSSFCLTWESRRLLTCVRSTPNLVTFWTHLFPPATLWRCWNPAFICSWCQVQQADDLHPQDWWRRGQMGLVFLGDKKGWNLQSFWLCPFFESQTSRWQMMVKQWCMFCLMDWTQKSSVPPEPTPATGLNWEWPARFASGEWREKNYWHIPRWQLWGVVLALSKKLGMAQNCQCIWKQKWQASGFWYPIFRQTQLILPVNVAIACEGERPLRLFGSVYCNSVPFLPAEVQVAPIHLAMSKNRVHDISYE